MLSLRVLVLHLIAPRNTRGMHNLTEPGVITYFTIRKVHPFTKRVYNMHHKSIKTQTKSTLLYIYIDRCTYTQTQILHLVSSAYKIYIMFICLCLHNIPPGGSRLNGKYFFSSIWGVQMCSRYRRTIRIVDIYKEYKKTDLCRFKINFRGARCLLLSC